LPEPTSSASGRIKKLRNLTARSDVDLWAIDEVHFQQYGSRCRLWIAPDVVDPIVRHFPGRKSVGYLGAVRLRDGRFVFRREPECFNAQTCWDFLKQLDRTSASPGRRVVVITDNAKYHHAKLHEDWRAQRADRFTLDYLPPYSPDLNPIERVWKLVRRLRLHNRYLASLDDIVLAVEGLFARWHRGNETLRRLCAII
jgi:transposase